MTDYSDHPNLMERDSGEDEIDLLEYARIIWRHRWSIIGLTLLAAIWGTLSALSQVPIYQSQATMVLEPDAEKVINIQDVYSVDQGRSLYQKTQIDILRSRTLAEKVMKRLQLGTYAHTPDTPLEVEPEEEVNLFDVSLNGWAREQLDLLGFAGARPKGPTQEEITKTASINQFIDNIQVSAGNQSSIIEVSYRSPDRLLAARVANTLTDTYIENELDARLQMTSKANSWLMERLGGLREKLRESEAALQAFLEKADIVAVNGSSTLTEQRLQSINTQLNEAEKARNEIKYALDQVRTFGGDSVSRLSSIPSVMNDPVFGSLTQKEIEAARDLEAKSKRYGPKHPSMERARLNLEAARRNTRSRLNLILDGLQEEYKIASANVAGLKRQFNRASADLQSMNRKGHELSVLEREVATNRQLYDRFLSRFKETKEAGDLQKVSARVIDPAVPSLHPIKPQVRKIIFTAAAIGLALGLAIAFLLERMDRTLKRPAEIEEKLHIPQMGALPHLKLRHRKGETPLSHARSNRSSFFAESIRTLRTGVLLSGLDNPKKIIVVTSSIPGEGKSTVAMNLANSIGDMDKVLLIDADMRRPTIGKHWGLARDTKGLSEFVAESAKLAECVHPIENSKVYVMPSGRVPPNPLEILSSKRFSHSLESLSASFDYIVIDSAPALAVSDSLILSSYASGVVYVIKSMSTPYPMAREGIRRLLNSDAHIIGGILNALPINTGGKYFGRYRYLGYYHKEYYGSYGYTKETGT